MCCLHSWEPLRGDGIRRVMRTTVVAAYVVMGAFPRSGATLNLLDILPETELPD